MTELEYTDAVLRRVRDVVMKLVDAQPTETRQQMASHIRETGDHGVDAILVGKAVEFHWGGQLLGMVECDLLADPTAPLPDLLPLPSVPDTVEGLE